MPICSLDFSLKNSTTKSFSISWFYTNCTQTILTHTWGPDKQISFYLLNEWLHITNNILRHSWLICLKFVCHFVAARAVLPHLNIICFKWCDAWKVEICRNIHKPSSTTSPTKTFAIPAMAITTLGGMEVPPVTLCISWKTKKHKTKQKSRNCLSKWWHNASYWTQYQHILKFGTWWKSCQWW